MNSRNENRICDLFWIKTLKGQIIFNLLGSDSVQYAKMDQFNSYAWKWNLGSDWIRRFLPLVTYRARWEIL